MKQFRTPITFILAPFVLFAVLLGVMLLLHKLFNLPGVFDFLDPNSPLIVRIADDISSVLFMILIVTPWVGTISIMIGFILLTKQLINKRKYAKN